MKVSSTNFSLLFVLPLILGRHPVLENVFMACGFSGHGIQQGPAVGRAMSGILRNQGPAVGRAMSGILRNQGPAVGRAMSGILRNQGPAVGRAMSGLLRNQGPAIGRAILGSKDIEIRKVELVTKTQFL